MDFDSDFDSDFDTDFDTDSDGDGGELVFFAIDLDTRRGMIPNCAAAAWMRGQSSNGERLDGRPMP